jgi:hypothetical protein
MSVRIVCDNCGRVSYSAAADQMIASGYRCTCGAIPRTEKPGERRPADRSSLEREISGARGDGRQNGG